MKSKTDPFTISLAMSEFKGHQVGPVRAVCLYKGFWNLGPPTTRALGCLTHRVMRAHVRVHVRARVRVRVRVLGCLTHSH
jgi:hypothetical protein